MRVGGPESAHSSRTHEYVNPPARVAQLLHGLRERLEFGVAPGLSLGAQPPVVERRVRAQGLLEVAVPVVPGHRVERCRFARATAVGTMRRRSGR